MTGKLPGTLRGTKGFKAHFLVKSCCWSFRFEQCLLVDCALIEV